MTSIPSPTARSRPAARSRAAATCASCPSRASPGQVAVAYEHGDVTCCSPPTTCARRWFAEELAAGRLLMLGASARATRAYESVTLREFVRERPTVLLPAHDADAPKRLVEGEVSRVSERVRPEARRGFLLGGGGIAAIHTPTPTPRRRWMTRLGAALRGGRFCSACAPGPGGSARTAASHDLPD